jgi:HD-GYP domain-containing protein (c-di-GMP phosphodiesterase class II)
MISGHADMSDALNSINQAGIFRLMLKPCPTEEIAAALNAGLEQNRLIMAEKQLLEGTLNGALHALTDILSLLDPEAYGQAQLRGRIAGEVARALGQPSWAFETAALLADIGHATLPPLLGDKVRKRLALSEPERLLAERVPEFSARLLKHIPRLEAVAEAVLYQDKHFNGAGFPAGTVSRAALPLGARVLHVVKAMIQLTTKGTSPETAIEFLKQGPERYDPKVVQALYACVPLLSAKKAPAASGGPRKATLATLTEGMVLLADITTTAGMMVLATGTRLTPVYIQRILNFAELNPLAEPFLVEMPPTE